MIREPVSRITPTARAGLLLAALISQSAAAMDDHGLISALANAEYSGIYDQPVKLTDGRFEGQPFDSGSASRPTVSLVREQIALGDLDGDGEEDAAALLVESSGGSGSFVYLAAISFAGGEPRNLATTLIGDRVQVRGLSYENQTLKLDMVVAGEEDAAASPTTKVRKTFRLSDGKLTASATEELDTLSLADLQGTHWILTGMIEDDGEVQFEGEITTSFEEGRIAGNAGCNRYFGDIDDEGRGALIVIELGATRMACPRQVIMDQEQAFLDTLGQIQRFGYRFGSLVLSGPGGALVFAPQDQ